MKQIPTEAKVINLTRGRYGVAVDGRITSRHTTFAEAADAARQAKPTTYYTVPDTYQGA